MKTLRLFMIAAVGIMLLALLAGCSRTSDQKVADAKANVVAAKEDVQVAVADAQSAARDEWLAFKKDAETKIDANDKIVADYKTRMTNADGKIQAMYDKKIDALQEKNKVLKTKLNDYKESGKSAWEQFKSEFNHDIAELGTALKDFTVDNKK